MLSFADDDIPATDDAVVKASALWTHWATLFAGCPSLAADILGRARSHLDNIKPPESADSLIQVKAAMHAAYKQELRQQLTDRFLAKYPNLSLEDFWRVGRRRLGPIEFESTAKLIREFKMGVQFIVCGIGHKQPRLPHIFEVAEAGLISGLDDLGHWAIGSGAKMALGALGNRNLGSLSIPDLIYRLCDARFTAGTAPGVGKSTVVTVVTEDGIGAPLRLKHTKELKRIWQEERDKGVPTEARELIERLWDANERLWHAKRKKDQTRQ